MKKIKQDKIDLFTAIQTMDEEMLLSGTKERILSDLSEAFDRVEEFLIANYELTSKPITLDNYINEDGEFILTFCFERFETDNEALFREKREKDAIMSELAELKRLQAKYGAA